MSKVLRLARVFHGLTQSEIAERLGIARSYVSEIESGKRPVGLGTLRKYASVFKIPTSSLMFFMEKVEEGYFVPSEGLLQEKALAMLEWIQQKAGVDDVEE